MCEAAAFAAAAVRPALMTMIGLVSATSRAAERNERASPIDLHVDDDAPGVRIVAEVVDEVAPADIEHRADRDERAEADVLSKAPIEDRGAQRAALADEPDATRPRHARREGRIHACVRAHHAEAIRADDPHPRRAAFARGPASPAQRPLRRIP